MESSYIHTRNTYIPFTLSGGGSEDEDIPLQRAGSAGHAPPAPGVVDNPAAHSTPHTPHSAVAAAGESVRYVYVCMYVVHILANK